MRTKNEKLENWAFNANVLTIGVEMTTIHTGYPLI